MKLLWHDQAWEDYLYWHTTDKRVLKRIHQLIKDIGRGSYDGIGKPEPLRANLQGWWSRRIDAEHRLVYCLSEDVCHILQCKGHYNK